MLKVVMRSFTYNLFIHPTILKAEARIKRINKKFWLWLLSRRQPRRVHGISINSSSVERVKKRC